MAHSCETQSNNVAIPAEVLFCIGQKVDRQSLASCTRVCRSWQQVFVTFFWDETFVDLSGQLPSPSFSNLNNHSHLVYKLVLRTNGVMDFPRQDPLTFPKLKDLTIERYNEGSLAIDESLVAFITRHRMLLESVTFYAKTSEKFLDALSACPLLKKVSLRGLAMATPDLWMDRYESLWSRLQTFSSEGPWFFDMDSDTPPDTTSLMTRLREAQPTKLKDIYLELNEADNSLFDVQSVLILKSPELVRLSWINWSDDVTKVQIAALAKACREGYAWSRLESLAIPWSSFKNEDLAVVLGTHSATLQDLNFQRSKFGPRSWQILQNEIPQFSTRLRKLNLRHCRQVKGLIVQDILCTVSSLEAFQAEYVKDTTLEEDGRTWVCLGLRELTVAFISYKGVPEQSIFLDQLARLKRLESLDMSTMFLAESISSDLTKVRYLELTLERGLDQLRTLRRLRTLVGSHDQMCRWTEVEAEWVLEHWPRLESTDMIHVDPPAAKLLKPRITILGATV
ncbi:hypothetical protein BGZ83_007507 [Gryganskiella cystojenkinii]|nr:hypothetical protein BGZ83_007507 [Gryganskiella cystojenkinii]